MSHQSSANRLPRSSARHSPYPRSSSPASAHSSAAQSSPHRPSPSGCHATSGPTETSASLAFPYDVHPPAASASPHPTTTNSVVWYPPVYPSPTPDPIYVAQPSTSTYQIEHSGYQDNLLDPQSTQLPNLPHQRISSSYHPHPFTHPTTNVPYSDPTIAHPIHSLPSAQSAHQEKASTIRQPGDLTYQDFPACHRPLQLPLRRASISEGRSNQGPGMFYGAHHFTIQSGTFGDNISDDFMKEFLLHTITGAEYDSSDRDPPPRCHPGTRLAIIERCMAFITECHGEEKMRWVVGPAGAGKSAIMQIVAEEAPADASVFLSVNGRRDGKKVFNTIAYQLATKYEPYRQFISKEINRDPSLFRKALPAQFQKFIVEPFIHQRLFNPSDRFIIIIDGLDECDNPATQRELLGLISYLCLLYPTSPVVWFIASRPEPHITSFFEDVRVTPAYAKEEIMINSNEACEDVQRYLRAELGSIKITYTNLRRKREWPSDLEFTKIATAAGGLFAYASTVLRYIGDPHYGDPVSQLGDVLITIDSGPKSDMLNNPLALLDALYDRIISRIPDGTMTNTRKLLLVQSDHANRPRNKFRKQCNRLGLTEDEAYGAVHHLHAVMKVPAPERADDECLAYFHKSFNDFLGDFKRSRFSRDILDEIRLLQAQCSFRIVQQVPDNFNDTTGGVGIKCGNYGYLKGNPGYFTNISLSWPGDERFPTTDEYLRLDLYRDSMEEMCLKFAHHDKFYWSIFCFHALTTRFTAHGLLFPNHLLPGCAFDMFRPELMEVGKLKQVLLWTLDYAAICGWILVLFTSHDDKYSDPWNPICTHQKSQREGLNDLRRWRGWETTFGRFLGTPVDTVVSTDTPRFDIKAGKDHHWKRFNGSEHCTHCFKRLARLFIDNPDYLATVFVDSTEMCYVELSFVDPHDGISEWKYQFYHSGAPICNN